jgi:hypothetical protein
MTPGSRIWAKVPYHPTAEPEPASSAMKPRRPAAQASPHTPPIASTGAADWAGGIMFWLMGCLQSSGG